MTIRKPEVFFLGAPKCGTTAIASYLADHPLIYVSDPKEPNYFCKDLKAGGLVGSDDEYLQTFFPGLDQSETAVALDASVWYLYSQVALNEILHFNQDARFLVMLRNPIEMVWSLYQMLTFQGQEDQKKFLVAWDLQKKRRRGLHLPQGLWLDRRMLLYRDVCALGSQLQKVYNSVGRERVHVELQDDLKCEPRRVYLRILEFMGIPDDGRTMFPQKNAGRKINNTLLYVILRNPLVMRSAVIFKRFFGLKTLGFGRPDMPMPEHVRSFLAEQFEDEIALLENLLKRNLDHWLLKRSEA